MPRIGDLILSSVDTAEAFVPPAETPVSPADASSAVVSIHLVGVGVVPANEGEPVKTTSGQGCYVWGF